MKGARAMPRFYVEHNGEWNIYSTVIDGFVLPKFIPFEKLKEQLLEETIKERSKEIDSLLTDNPKLNTMDYTIATMK